MIKLKKITKGIYYDTVSNRYIDLVDGKWCVTNECTGDVYFSGNTLKECKQWQQGENEILNWNN
tara:strand:+ start:356 stop:547 length:192 start_codon:yes stop_codon:yes gene_type:complete